MTLDRLLVLLLSLSFLLLAPPAAAHMAVQPPAPVILAEQKGPEPARPDDTGLFLLSSAPEAPPPTGTDEAGGHDALALPALFGLPRLASMGVRKVPAGLFGTCQACAHPWPTGPPCT